MENLTNLWVALALKVANPYYERLCFKEQELSINSASFQAACGRKRLGLKSALALISISSLELEEI